MTGRQRDLALHLLDRQVVDTRGRAVGNVDDVVLLVPDDGSPPYVVALLTGPGALGPRLGGALGRWVTRLSRTPGRIGMELLVDLGSAVTVSRSRRELGVHEAEDWAREHLVDHIPGARGEP